MLAKLWLRAGSAPAQARPSGSTPPGGRPSRHTGKSNSSTPLASYWGHPNPEPGPQAFLVSFPESGATVTPHFHPVRQFQVFAGGTGRIGKKAIKRMTFHYTDANTPYGPIVASESGIAFFTLREQFTSKIHYMPGSRDKMGGRAGRAFVRHFSTEECEEHKAGEAAADSLIDRQTDGLEAVGVHLGAGANSVELEKPAGGGQFLLVAAGELVGPDSRKLQADSLLWADPGEAPSSLAAGRTGAHVLVLRFPSL